MAGTVYGWVDIDEADEYAATRLGASAYWVSGAAKAAALMTAYYDILDAGIYTFPDDATDVMKRAQFEQAFFRLRNTEMEERVDLQLQGVVEAGIVKERYRAAYPPRVLAVGIPDILSPYVSKGAIQVVSISRNRNRDANNRTLPGRRGY